MPDLWYGADHTGNATTTLANSWISVTLPRPIARTDMEGKKPFLVKKVAWKTCAAPSQGQKMYGRISSADGSVYDNSYIGNTISWQNEAKVTYEFQAINMHFADDGGAKIRAWLVSGGPFYFARNATASGTIETVDGKSYSGTPVGYVEYAEVALPPTGVQVARDSADGNKTNVLWTEWDVKADFAAVGGTYAVSGYCLQVARDSGFSQDVRYAYVSKGTASVYGLYQGYDWYFRMATRNEVSEHYNLKGGIWGDTVKLAATVVVVATPGDTDGLPENTTDPTTGTDSDADGAIDDNNPSSTSGTTTSGTTSGTDVADKNAAKVLARSALMQTHITALTAALDAANQNPTSATWDVVKTYVSTLASDLRYVIARTTDPTVLAQWIAVQVQVQTASDAVSAAKSAASAAQSSGQKLYAAEASTTSVSAAVVAALATAVARATAESWQPVADRLSDLRTVALTAAALTDGDAKSAWTAAASTINIARANAQSVVNGLTQAKVGTARDTALQATDAAKAASAATPAVAPEYAAGVAAIGAAADGVVAAIATGTNPVLDTSGSSTSTATGTVVYTPIPDTSALRTSFGGLLLSRSPRTTPGHTVYLMDRGGRQRIEEFKDLSKVTYNRIRDDQSTCVITLDGTAVARNQALLDKLSVGRHELCVYRGAERVWEGPITLATWKADAVEISAKDITHYLNRTVMKAAYSNAYPNLDYVVNRIAGIIANELGIKESLNPPVNILPFMHTYVQDGDARTTRVTLPAESTVWGHLDDLAARGGIDYTVIGRSLHIWDTSRPAFGRVRTVTEADFLGDTYISAYGMEVATSSYVSDGQGNFGRSGGVDDYYGEIELLATAYDENGLLVDQTDLDPTNDTIPIEQMVEQADRNLKGRNPTPMALHVPDGSAFRMDRGLGMDVMIPGVYIPVSATLSGRTLNQTMKLLSIVVTEDAGGEVAAITLTPAAADDSGLTLEDDGS